MNELIQTLAVYAIPMIFAITLHESAHAFVARYFGDDTAYLRGRLSLNPLKHIDPIGTLLLPALMLLVSKGTFAFGYAKPVPVNFSALRNPKRDMIWVALAGPASNFFMALIWFLSIYAMVVIHFDVPFLLKMAQAGIAVNVIMFALNLFPMLPLDGGRILVGLLPMKQAYQFSKIEPYGFFIVLGLLWLNLLDKYWLNPVASWTETSLQLLLTPLQFLIK
ncbi:site-2 protease family protein [Solimicrobium silvestre]|uniref:Zn-dependent protease n=1 Tax=Solimicrobium silvestre TaxID=2099400 RepID=A0A2S9GSK2_9BURK|nr:site-2 protease family protein [Solimicrobium silvestre]PRC90691.1 Zn-dependent protease [Solimicrobium silvestre]